MEELIGKIKLKSSNLPKKELLSLKLIYLMDVKLQMNLTLSLQAPGVNWKVKFQMTQQPSNPTKTNHILSWKQNKSQ